jgi:hypothetical protein
MLAPKRKGGSMANLLAVGVAALLAIVITIAYALVLREHLAAGFSGCTMMSPPPIVDMDVVVCRAVQKTLGQAGNSLPASIFFLIGCAGPPLKACPRV